MIKILNFIVGSMKYLEISLLLIGSDEIENEYLVIGITEAEIDKSIF